AGHGRAGSAARRAVRLLRRTRGHEKPRILDGARTGRDDGTWGSTANRIAKASKPDYLSLRQVVAPPLGIVAVPFVLTLVVEALDDLASHARTSPLPIVHASRLSPVRDCPAAAGDGAAAAPFCSGAHRGGQRSRAGSPLRRTGAGGRGQREGALPW